MKRTLAAIIFTILISGSANAALLSRAGGQAYYDTDLNITWLADANLAATNTFGVSGVYGGQMSWYQAHDWVAGMNNASYLGVSNWRLPSEDVNMDTTIVDCQGEPNCPDNEMGFMYWYNHITAVTPSPFTNIQPDFYWSGTEFASLNTYAWDFLFSGTFTGYTSPISKSSGINVWPVSPGDLLAVPIPAAAFLFPSALGLLGWRRRRA